MKMRADTGLIHVLRLVVARTALVALLCSTLPMSIHAENLDKCLEGETLLKAGDPSAAIKQLNACIGEGHLSNESLAITYRNMGFAYRHLKDPGEAIIYFNRAIALHPSDPWSDYVNRGNAYDDQGRFELALADYDAALKLKPGFGEAYYNRGVLYEHQKKFDKARNEFIEAYRHGLRSDLLYDRFVVYGLIQASDERGDGKSNQQKPEDKSDATKAPNVFPLTFKEHNFDASCYNTIGCRVIYDNHDFSPYAKGGDPDVYHAPPPPSVDYKSYWGPASYIGVRNFPSPAQVRWTSLDGTAHEAKIDIGEIFKDERVLHNVPESDYVEGSFGGSPSIFLEVNDRTINVYMEALIATKSEQIPGNKHSYGRTDLILVWSHTY